MTSALQISSHSSPATCGRLVDLVASETSYNRMASSGNQWAVLWDATVSKVVRVGHMPVSFGLGGFYNLERP
ncbi:hypothetical protein IP90_01116 [Luteimonas cucumeris]|uniref:Uncharacterized protein n=1 Tax=Luteimonas cucumeris TaxID=985012 RepID=A0A562LBZ1_9GAMM|nr:hypothetical protein IP90_01116 [Luteimonas cucumeris]